MHTIIPSEYKRRVFNKCLLECFSRIHEQACCDANTEPEIRQMANDMANSFFSKELNLDKNSIQATKRELSEAVTFIQDCIKISESIATVAANDAKEEKLEIPDDQEIEISDEGEALLDKVFADKSPDIQLDAVRDATVKALVKEDQKAQEIKDSITIAQQQSTEEGNPEIMEETVNRLAGRGPTSLMNAIMNAVASNAVKSVNETSDHPVSVGSVMKSNAEPIRDAAIAIYALYETTNVFGIKKWTKEKLAHEAKAIYYGK